MTTGSRDTSHALERWVLPLLAISVAICLMLGAVPASGKGGDDDGDNHGPCFTTSLLQLLACRNELRDDFFIAKAICINISDEAEREECLEEALAERDEARELCGEQLSARDELCEDLGPGRYDPDVDPDDFATHFNNLNPHFPVQVGNSWTYVGGDETITVEVLDKTKLIDGVTCIVANDVVEEDGEVIEDTDDWYGQRLDGTVDYCGEISQNFEIFEGDEPEEAELVDIEGSFKAGRDGDKSGTRFPGSPEVGDLYRQEWSPNNAEDVALVLSTSYGFGNDPELDEFVPRELADLLCNDDCVVTGEFTPIEPDAFERKYHAPGIGTFLEVDPESGDIVQLVECSIPNMAAQCDNLPQP